MAEVTLSSCSSIQSKIHLWDSIGAKYEVAFHRHPAQLRSLRWILIHLAGDTNRQTVGAKCLDIGCGTGRPVCHTLDRAGHEVLGIDISPEMIKAAQERVPGATFEVADIRNWRPDTEGDVVEEYDVITAYFSLIDNITRAEIRETISRIHRWLKTGGVFVFATIPVHGDQLHIKWMGRDVIVSGLTTAETREYIEGEIGFEVVKLEEGRFLPRGVEARLVEDAKDVEEELQLFVYARKK